MLNMESIYYGMLVTNSWVLLIALCGLSIAVCAVCAEAIEPVVHHTDLGRLAQAMVLFWGPVAFTLSQTFDAVFEVERRRDKVLSLIEDASGTMNNLISLTGLTVDASNLLVAWGEIVRGNPSRSSRGVESAAEHVKGRIESSHALEKEVQAVYSQYAADKKNHSEAEIAIVHDDMMALRRHMQAFRSEALVGLEASNIVLWVLIRAVLAGLGPLLNALEITNSENTPETIVQPDDSAYYWLTLALAVMGNCASVFLIHGNFVLHFYGPRFHARTQALHKEHFAKVTSVRYAAWMPPS